jgi:DNA processing protein
METQQGIRDGWLTLASVIGVSPKQWLALLEASQLSVAEFVSLHSSQWASLGLSESIISQLQQAPQKLTCVKQWLQASPRHHIIHIQDDHYPAMLQQLASPPLVLFCQGNTRLLNNTQIAIVGGRKATYSGRQEAKQFGAELSGMGITVTSGLALGIDGQAHLGAYPLPGRTIAVVGAGIDIIYPKRHQNLAANILLAEGLIISEFWLATPPKPVHFPRRNRVIAAMSLGTLVVEAQIKSGSLITAGMAADMGREVFAIPGNIRNPMAQGCHYLIQQGAKLVTSTYDILEEFPDLVDQEIKTYKNENKKSDDEDLATDTILDSVDLDVTSVDVIAKRNGLPIPEVMAVLLEYELRGWVAAVPGGYINLRRK